jgi:hypothetical protein
MIWSFSSARTFMGCQRRWFFKNRLASATAADPLRREAYVLSKVQSLQAWRGNIVDDVMNDVLVPGLNRGLDVTVGRLLQYARNQFDARLRNAIGGTGPDTIDRLRKGGVLFWTAVYGGEHTAEQRAQAWNDIETSIRGVYGMPTVRALMRGATVRFAQRALQFPFGDVNVRAVPDVIAFYGDESPTIVDWKVNTGRARDYRLQLALYSLALSRTKPHRDFPAASGKPLEPTQVRVFEAQLLRASEYEYSITDADVADVEDLIASTATEMRLLADDPSVTLNDLDSTRWPNLCSTCEFRRLCWGDHNAATATDERGVDSEPRATQAALSFGDDFRVAL